MEVKTREYLTPDHTFLRQIGRLGGQALKKCFQCGSCSVLCTLSPDQRPFPRKEMIWAAWGLKDRILQDPDIWLCHQCEDCSTQCPRGATPSEVMAALRHYAILHLAVPRFLARALSRAAYLPLVLLLPALVLLGLVGSTGRFTFPEGPIVFSRFLPIRSIDIATLLVVGFALAVMARGLGKFWQNLSQPAGSAPAGNPSGPVQKGLLRSYLSALGEIFQHRHFRQCEARKSHYFSHMAMFYGFLLLALTTTGSAIYYFLGRASPYPLTDPVKVMGNLGALLLLAGSTLAIYLRLSPREGVGKGGYFDWFFIILIYLVTLTGILSQVARIAELAPFAYSAYLAHLWLVFTLFMYAPFSKFSHIAYRTLALAQAQRFGRKLGLPMPGDSAPGTATSSGHGGGNFR